MHPLKVARKAMVEHHALQKDAELAGLLSLLADLEPQVVVEIGCDAGGTLWAWQQLKPRRVIGVDLPRGGFHSARPLEAHGAEMIVGNSHEQTTLDTLLNVLAGDEVDFLFIDADHTYAGAKTDLKMYGPLVRPGGIVAFHDICNHPTLPQVDVNRLWREVEHLPGAEPIVAEPATWGGIGVLRVASVAVSA